MITVNFELGNIEFVNQQIYSEPIIISFHKNDSLNLDFIIDQEVIEFFGNNGIIYGAVETEENILRKKIVMDSVAELETMKLFEII